MNLDLALSIMRTGEGELRPIIDYYAKTKNENELIPYIIDDEIGLSVLYILSEIPSISNSVISEIKRLLIEGLIINSGKTWADEIIFNHRLR